MRYLHENYSNKEIEHEYKRRLEDKSKIATYCKEVAE